MKKQTITTILITGLLVTNCSDGSRNFIGKHTINLPLYTTNYDTTKTVNSYNMAVHPEVHYYDLYASSIEFYKTDDNKLAGQLKYVYPEGNKMFVSKLTISERTFEFKNIHLLNDTLNFLIEAGGFQNVSFEGCAYEQNKKVVIGLPKTLFKWIHTNSCMESLIKESREFIYVIADQPVNKKEFYSCQIDSLKHWEIANPKFNNRYKLTLEFLNKLVN